MQIEKIELHHISMDLVHPFQTSFGTQVAMPRVLVSVHAGGLTGWGECTAGDGPFFSPESAATNWVVLQQYLLPMVIGQEVPHPSAMDSLMNPVRGNQIAKGGLENAVWDLFAKAAGTSLKEMIGGTRDRVPVGVSIGIQPSVEALLERVGRFVAQGYGRVKIKIKKGKDYDLLAPVRDTYPDLLVMADANSDYELADRERLMRLDELKLLMIEQPLRYYDILDHARLQSELETPICLDESITRPDDARYAIELKACRMINVKICRVGGMTNALRIHDLTREAGLPVWCGGMLETGIGRATNLAMASLPNFTLPGDISATDRYYAKDITRPFVLNREDSTLSVPTEPGIGVEVDEDRVAGYRLRRHCVEASNLQ